MVPLSFGSKCCRAGHFECHCHFLAEILVHRYMHWRRPIPNAAAPTPRTILSPPGRKPLAVKATPQLVNWIVRQ
jgi:hypothetical protein